VAAALLVLTMSVFAQVGAHDFVDLDDGLYVVENENVRGGLTAENVHWAFTTGRAANWHPLTWMSHQTDVTLFGMDAGAHHIVSVGWHTLNVLLLFGLLRSATGAAWRSALVAALFAVHPAHVESVAWIAERKDVLSTSFWLGSTWLWIAWTRRRTAGWIGGALAVFAAGLMAKPMLITVPVTWLILDVWPLGRTAVSWRQRIVEKLPFFALAAASLVVTFLVQQQGGAVASLDRVSIVDRLANAVASFGTYLRVLVWPTNLAAFYPFVLPVPAVRVGIGGVLLALGSVAAWWRRRPCPHIAAGWAWFVVTLLPVIGLIQIGTQSHADRYTYVPFIGLFITVAWAAEALAVRVRGGRAVAIAVWGFAVIALAVAAHAQTATWRSSETLWLHATAVTTDNAKAHNLLGAIYGNSGRVADAEVHFKEALRIRPDLSEGIHIYPNLGRSLVAQGKVAEAIPYLEQACRMKPEDATLASELGFAYLGVNRPSDAVRTWREAVRLDPKLEQTWFALGISLAAEGRVADARDAFGHVLEINPNRREAAFALERLK
jgi:protein O-mannosyl-transferase